MKTILFLVFLVAIGGTSAYAQPKVNCSQFQQNDDDSWSAIVPMTISAPKGSFQLIPGLEFRAGVPLMGLDLGTMLYSRCEVVGQGR